MHRFSKWSAVACMLVAALMWFAATAVADNGNGHGGGHGDQSAATAQGDSGQGSGRHGQSGDHGGPPQQQSSDNGAPPAASSEHARTASDGSKQYGNGKSALEIASKNAPSITSSKELSGPGASGLHKVTICHATGNGFVEITVDVHALKEGHTAARGDIIPAPAGGCPTASAPTPEAAAMPQEQTKPAEVKSQEVSKPTEVKPQEVENETEATSETAQGENEQSPEVSKPTEVKSQEVENETEATSEIAQGENESEAARKVTICHATGNGFVEITVDEHALKEGHTAAKGDIIPAPASGCPTTSTSSGVSAAVSPQAPEQEQEATEQETPEQESAEQETPAPAAPEQEAAEQETPEQEAAEQETPAPAAPAPLAPSPVTPTQQGAAPQVVPPTQQSQGVAAATKTKTQKTAAAKPKPKAKSRGVLAAQKTIKRAPKSSGVLGAATGATLPFTGFPLWLAVLAAGALLGAGLLLNCAGKERG